jgi:hypothetical protein
MLGAAVLACELAGQPWPAIDLAKLKLHASKGHAGKPETQAAAKGDGDVDQDQRASWRAGPAPWMSAGLAIPVLAGL